jgi:hypothetical protein
MAPVTIETDRTAIAGRAGWPALAAAFASDRRLLLPGLVGPRLLARVLARLKSATFSTRVATRVHPPAVDLKLQDPILHGTLQYLLNDTRVIELVRAVAGIPSITGYVGAVYRLLPGHGHRDSWHSDADGNRRVGLTVNLSEGPFEGGELELRDRRSRRVLWRVHNGGSGDGLLFPIDAALQHRIRPMGGTAAKTALAGWFCEDADRRS